MRELRPAPPALKLVMLAVLVWFACFYALFGPLLFDIAYYLLGIVPRVRACRRLHVGLSSAVAVACVIGLLIRSLATPT